MNKNQSNSLEQQSSATLLDVAKNHALAFRKASSNDRCKLTYEIKWKINLLQNFYNISSTNILDNILDNIKQDVTAWENAKKYIMLSVDKVKDAYIFITAKQQGCRI